MKSLCVTAALSIALAGWISVAGAEPWNDNAGKDNKNGYQRDDNGWLRRAEADRLGCTIERKWTGSQYKDEMKCKDGWRSPSYRN